MVEKNKNYSDLEAILWPQDIVLPPRSTSSFTSYNGKSSGWMALAFWSAIKIHFQWFCFVVATLLKMLIHSLRSESPLLSICQLHSSGTTAAKKTSFRTVSPAIVTAMNDALISTLISDFDIEPDLYSCIGIYRSISWSHCFQLYLEVAPD